MLFKPPELNPKFRPLKQRTRLFSDDAGRRSEMTIGVVTNPWSGGNKGGIGYLRTFLAQNPDIRHGEAVTPEEVKSLLVDFSARDIDLLVVNGGDGTVQAVLSALFGCGVFPRTPVLALLRAGTMSMLARDVGVAGAPRAALARIRAWNLDNRRFRHRFVERPVLKVRRGPATAPLCGMFFGAGAILQGIDLCHKRMNPRGVRGEGMPGLIMARLLLAALFGNDRLVSAADIRICIGKEPSRPARYLLAMVSTLDRLFLGMHPFWGDAGGPLHFTALAERPAHLLRNLPFLLRGRRTATATPQNGFLSCNARRITLDFKGRFTLDGEIFQTRGPLTIEAAGPARFFKL